MALFVGQTNQAQPRRTAVQMEKWQYPLHRAVRRQEIWLSPDEHSREAETFEVPLLDKCSGQNFRIARDICIYQDGA